jgi:hypothetical protein
MAMKQKEKKQKKKVKVFGDLEQSLRSALAYEQGNPVALRVTELPPPPKNSS